MSTDDMSTDDKKEFEMRDVFKPGVFRIECIPKKKALFETSINVWMHARSIFNGLQKGESDIPELLEDYKKYGVDGFDVKFMAYGEEYWDPVNVDQALDDAKNEWQGDLYK